MGRRSMAGSAWILRGEGKESMRSPVIVFDSSRHAFHEFRQLKVVAINGPTRYHPGGELGGHSPEDPL
jgi:hypothetical protein